MNLKFLRQLFLLTFLSSFFFACSSGKYYSFNAPAGGAYHQTKTPAKKYVSPEDRAPQANEFAPTEKEYTPDDYGYLATADEEASASAGPAVPAVKASLPVYLQENQTKTAVSEKAAETKPALTKKEQKLLKKLQKKLDKQKDRQGLKADVPLVALVIIALFIPPLAVFLHSGIGTPFWISLLLTLLFVLPGIIYAILVVTDTI